LIVGAGGLGCPAAIALAKAGVSLSIADDDLVERSNLHRQILYTEDDLGRDKLDVAKRSLEALVPGAKIDLVRSRALPDNVLDLVRRFDVIVEGSDNFATKFMVADACAIAKIPVVHSACVRWHGTVLAVSASAQPCYRCLFEDIPHEAVQNCAEAGVMGPVCGIIGALQADLALAMLSGKDVGGTIITFDGKTDRFRKHTIQARTSCPLCGLTKTISSIDPSRYFAEHCAA
jgi:adenylyltransferase/sulfurtransferase